MKKIIKTPPILLTSQDKGTDFPLLIHRFREYLRTHPPATAMMVCNTLGCYRHSVCSLKLALQKAGLLQELYKAKCRITGHPAFYLTCNPDQFKQDPQLSLHFDDCVEPNRMGGRKNG